VVRNQSRKFLPDKTPPGIAVYRVVLLGRVEEAVFLHKKGGGRGWWADPPGTWRASGARVIGPIVATNQAELEGLEDYYEVPAVWLGNDINEVMAGLQDREPASNPEPCPECRYRVAHAVDCASYREWWGES
jgi:hypothetical protein